VSYARRIARALKSPALAAPVSIVVLALLASATSLANGFVYDDRPIIEANPRVHTLARWWEAFGQAYWPATWGDTNYRPVTILSFAVQWAIGDGSPAVFHAVSVGLYLAACLAVLGLARLVLPTAAAWVVAALFAVHPVHVEAVGNVVGQSELVVAICTTVAVTAYVRARAEGYGRLTWTRSLALIVALYAIASFAKESGFLLPALLLAAEMTVVATQLDPPRRTLRARAHELWPVYAACGAIAVVYLALRYSVLGGFGDDPNTVISMLGHDSRLLTMLGVVPEWARLLLWPARLSVDYSPPGIPVILGPAVEIVPGVLMLALVPLIGAASWQRQRVVAFGLMWLAITIFPVSNVVLRSGVILAERTLFMPSIGVLLAVGAGVAWIRARTGALGRPWVLVWMATVALLITLGVMKSASRQRVWRDPDEFHARIAQDAPRSYRAHQIHGLWLFEQRRDQEGERHLRRAIEMFPFDARLYVDLGDQYRQRAICGAAKHYYRRALRLGGFPERARLGLVLCLLYDGDFVEAASEARRGAAANGFNVDRFRRAVAVADSALVARGRPTDSGSGPVLMGTKRPIPK
jgi:hypothetical protein